MDEDGWQKVEVAGGQGRVSVIQSISMVFFDAGPPTPTLTPYCRYKINPSPTYAADPPSRTKHLTTLAYAALSSSTPTPGISPIMGVDGRTRHIGGRTVGGDSTRRARAQSEGLRSSVQIALFLRISR